MRLRTVAAVPVLLASMALAAPAAEGAEGLRMYRVTVDEQSVTELGELGVDMHETGYRPSEGGSQTIFVDLEDGQARRGFSGDPAWLKRGPDGDYADWRAVRR